MDQTTINDYVQISGVDPEDAFRRALDRVGATTRDTPDANGQWSSSCPVPTHGKGQGDRGPSLHWGATPNHVVKFNCFAGCSGADVMEALGLRWYELKPLKYDFDYYDATGTYRYTVRRTNQADGDKKYIQLQRGVPDETKGTPDTFSNGLAPGEGFLWLQPELNSFAEDARAAGQKITLWVPEGEKDAVAVGGSGSLGEWEFVTSAPQGATNWKQPQTERVAELWEAGVLGEVVIVCDSDKAGISRGHGIRDSLGRTIPDLPVRVMVVPLGEDCADLCDQYGPLWVRQLEEVDETNLTEALEEGSAVTGFMTRHELGAGSKPGRMGMGILTEDKLRPVLAAEFEPRAIFDGGWLVRVTPPRRDAAEYVLNHEDLATKASFDRWMVRTRVAMVPRCGIGTGEVAQSLGMWLDWWADSHHVERITVTPHLTWVDATTGEPAKTARPGERPLFVVPEQDDNHGVRWIGNDRAGSHWGKEGTELDAAWALARALTFGDEATVAGVAGWAGAMVLSPWLGRWMPTKPGLAIIAPSGSGKTHGAARLILQLIGCDGSSTSSVAGLRRRLSQGGVSAIQWIDDSAILDDFHLKEILRVATSQSEHTLANPDGGATATNTAKLVGCIVVSAEGVAWAEEVAMQDRFLFVAPANPQGRKSLRPGHEHELQWTDVQELRDEWDDELTRISRHVIDGLTSEEITSMLADWVKALGAPKGRGDVPSFLAAVGTRAIGTWLAGVKRRAGSAWPGNSPSWDEKRYRGWSWLVAEADAALKTAREAGPRYNTLVNSVLPAVLRADLAGVTGQGMTSLVLSGVRADDENTLRRSVYAKVQHGEKVETALPMMLIDHEDRIWIWVSAVATWYERAHRRSAEARINGIRALTDQLSHVEDSPEWAHWTESKGKGRNYERTGVKVGKREAGSNRAVYRRLSADASAAVLHGE